MNQENNPQQPSNPYPPNQPLPGPQQPSNPYPPNQPQPPAQFYQPPPYFPAGQTPGHTPKPSGRGSKKVGLFYSSRPWPDNFGERRFLCVILCIFSYRPKVAGNSR